MPVRKSATLLRIKDEFYIEKEASFILEKASCTVKINVLEYLEIRNLILDKIRKWLSGQYKVWHLEYFNRKEREKWHRIQ